MDFHKHLLKYLAEADQQGPTKTGTDIRKETKMGSATDRKSRDAARKRAERAAKPKREQMPTAELIKQIIAVKAGDGSTELIYKDSYNPNYHELVNPDRDLSVEDAKAFTKAETFIQTQASQQLFGDLKKKAEAKERKRATEAEGAPEKGDQEAGPEVEKRQFVKPKKLSTADLLASLGSMGGDQLGGLPFTLRQEYFLQNRDPMEAKAFDSLTFETIAAKFGISKVDLPYNEQVKNALIILSRVKAGASDQELSFVTNIKNGLFTQFGREAFEQAKKILSQVGDECLQLMVSASEAGMAGVAPQGQTDFTCGKIKFAVNAQGEISLSSSDPTQQGKAVKKTIEQSLIATMQDPSLASKDPLYQQAMTQVNDLMAASSTFKLSDATFQKLSKDPNMFAFMQNEPVMSAVGQPLGTIVMPNGELNPAISYKKFEQDLNRITDKFIAQQKSKKAPFLRSFVKSAVSMQIRGDNFVEPDNAPSHLVTGKGIFPLSDDYFDAIAANSDVNISKANVSVEDKKSDINRFAVVVEQTEMDVPVDPYQQMRDIVLSSATPIGATPIEAFAKSLTKNYNFDLNISLLPGVSPKDIHGVEYNFLTVQGKKFKIPVIRDQELLAANMNESYVIANNLILESRENDDVLRALYHTGAINFEQAENIVASRYVILETSGEFLSAIILELNDKLEVNPKLVSECAVYLEEKRKRNYKREYKLFHGKPSQIKKRAKRVTARRKLEREGKVHKGDGKDVDHKTPLRNGGSNGKQNLRVRSRKDNRSDNGKYKGQPADKPRTDE